VCHAGTIIIGKGEEQDQKMAAIKRVTYAFASESNAARIQWESDLSVLLRL
jgi:hypothetical protein